jgi:hypothetical protein
MSPEPEEYVKHYLARLGSDENAYHALIEPREGTLPHLITAFRVERDPHRSSLLLEIIWQHRDPSAAPVLAEALAHPAPAVWKEALNGLVALGLPACAAALEAAREREPQGSLRREWIGEALHQTRHGFFGEKDSPPAPP